MRVDLTLLEKIYEYISIGATGSPSFLARKLGISKRSLYMYIDYLKSKFGAPIAYSRSKETFYFTKEWEFYIGNLVHIKAEVIKGVLATLGKSIKLPY